METQETQDVLFDRISVRHRIEVLRSAGVTIVDPERTYVGDQATVGSGTVLLPGTYLAGSCSIGSGCRIGPDCWIEDSVIEDRCAVRYAVIESARVRADSTVGPYAHLRRGADVGPEARVGNFVEIKAARLERGVKAGHLAYIGDAEVGEESNIGAGAITCNYDGAAKHRTVIEKNVFVGSNASLVAPVTLGEGALVAAGSTITDDVPPGAVAFGRARQVNRIPDRDSEEGDT